MSLDLQRKGLTSILGLWGKGGSLVFYLTGGNVKF